MVCLDCGTHNDAGGARCNGCGASLREANAQTTFPPCEGRKSAGDETSFPTLLKAAGTAMLAVAVTLGGTLCLNTTSHIEARPRLAGGTSELRVQEVGAATAVRPATERAQSVSDGQQMSLLARNTVHGDATDEPSPLERLMSELFSKKKGSQTQTTPRSGSGSSSGESEKKKEEEQKEEKQKSTAPDDDDTESDEVGPTSRKVSGTTRRDAYEASRLVNGGHMVSDGKLLYYGDPIDGTDWTTRSITVCNLDGSHKRTFYKAPRSTSNLFRLNLTENYLIFNQVIENNSSIMCVKRSNGRSFAIDDCDDWSLCQVERDWVYYQKDHALRRYNLDDESTQKLVNLTYGTLWRITGSTLITYNEDGKGSIYSSTLTGKHRELLYRVPSGFTIKKAFPVGDELLIVWCESDDRTTTELSWIGLEDGASKRFWSEETTIERLCAYGNGVLVTDRDPAGYSRIMRIGYDGNSAECLTADHRDEQIRYTCYTGGRIVYGTIDDDLQCSVNTEYLIK